MTASPIESHPIQRAFRSGTFLLVACALGACGDLGTGPLVEVTTQETLPTLQLNASLPTFPEVVERWGGELPAETLSDRWERSWTRPLDEATLEREDLYRTLSPELARRFSADDLEPLERRLEEALVRIARDLPAETPEFLLGPISEARASARTARTARRKGDVPGALTHLFFAVDHLHSVSAEAIALSLLRDGEAALRRMPTDRSYEERSRGRAERLLLGAQDALEGGDDELALQRAFYGHQILTATEDR